MKIIKEHIVFEKFQEESDPIKDMSIGIAAFFKNEYQKLGLMNLKQLKKYLNIKSYNVGDEDTEMAICVITVDVIKGICNKQTVPNAFYDSYNFWKNTFLGSAMYKKHMPSPHYTKHVIQNIINKKYGIEWDAKKVYEKFVEESDPIKDMGIGLSYRLKEQLDKLQQEKNVYEISLKDNKLITFNYVIEVTFYYNDLEEFIKTFYKHIDRTYIDQYFYKSIGSLKTTIGFVIKNKYENAFVKAFEMIF